MSGGGTAGHVHPALSVAALLVAEGDEVTFVGTPDGLEARLVPEAGVAFLGLRARGFDRARPWTLVTSSARILVSSLIAYRWLGSMRPDVVMGFGGYVSIPVGIAAALRRIPLVLHEQNSVPGLANRLLSRWARSVATTYPDSQARLAHPERAILTGNPVRSGILEATRQAGRAALGIADDAVLLLAFGGSRGARHLNTALIDLKQRILAHPEVVVVHVAGRAEFGATSAALNAAGGDAGGRWRLLDYLEDMPSALAAADVVVSRAGATSIAEVTALGVAAVLVPYPYATDDHQTTNATAVEAAGGALLVADADVDGMEFAAAVDALLSDPGRRATMAAASRSVGRPDAAQRVVAVARSAASSTTRDG